MRIKKMYATFGKLACSELELGDGLNIICGDNESGKSTWSSFIRAMLYGISTREKARAGFMPDKEKYMPWNGSPMYGRMELLSSGQAITLERTAGRSGVLGAAKSTYDTTGAPAGDGAELVGAAREVYERTAFISQSQLRVDRDGELERRILSIAGSGEEDVSFGEIKNRLLAKKRSLRTVRDGGELTQTEFEIGEIRHRIECADEVESALSATKARLSEISDAIAISERKVLIKKSAAGRARDAFVKSAEDDLSAARSEADKYRSGPDRKTLDALSLLAREKVRAESELSHLKLLSSSEENEINMLREKAAAFPVFGGMCASEAELRAEADIELMLTRDKKRKGAAGALIPALCALLSAAFAFIFGGALFKTVLLSVAILSFAVSAFIFIKSRASRANGDFSCISELYESASEDEILSKLGDYLTILSDICEAEERAAQHAETIASANRNLDDIEKKTESLLTAVGLSGLSAEEGERRLSELVLARERALRAEADAKIRIDAIAAAGADTREENIEYSPDEIPEEPLEVLQQSHSELLALHRECELSIASLTPRAKAYDRAECEKNLAALEKRHKELSIAYDALDMALEELSLADSELKRRFSPEVSRRASEIFHELTGGSFEIVRILSSDFEMDVSEVSASAPRDILQLSRGTLDELYLSLRLALCELVLDGEKKPPIVLDDVFVNFDKTRLERALRLLQKLSENRQILLFTCHEREAQYFADSTDVRIIKLPSKKAV